MTDRAPAHSVLGNVANVPRDRLLARSIAWVASACHLDSRICCHVTVKCRQRTDGHCRRWPYVTHGHGQLYDQHCHSSLTQLSLLVTLSRPPLACPSSPAVPPSAIITGQHRSLTGNMATFCFPAWFRWWQGTQSHYGRWDVRAVGRRSSVAWRM